MALPHFFLTDQIIAEEPNEVFALRLASDDLKHARVLRLTPGEHIAVIDSTQDYFECEIVSFDRDNVVVKRACHIEDEGNLPRVVLVQGIAKGEKMDLIIRHATELGVQGFVPFACERSIVKLDQKKAAARVNRWSTIAKSAAMQSAQRAIPEVSQPHSLVELAEFLKNATAVLVCWEEAPQTATLSHALTQSFEQCGITQPSDARIAVVVGPEGGLTQKEVDALLACNPRSYLVSLGSSILRTETAGIVAPALVLYEAGGLGGVARL